MYEHIVSCGKGGFLIKENWKKQPMHNHLRGQYTDIALIVKGFCR
jgi:hypothetical protein